MHGVNGITYEIVQDLSDLAFEADEAACATETLLHLYPCIDYPSLIDGKNSFDELFAVHGGGAGGLPMEAQCLTRNGTNTAQLAVGGEEERLDGGNIVSSLGR